MIPSLSDRTDAQLARRFLAWAQSAPPEARAAGTAALARAAMDPMMSRAERVDAIAALTLALDDPQACVRRALAEELAARPDTPRHLILSLAADESSVAVVVIARSPLLSEGDLVELVATRTEDVQIAVATRPELSGPVAAALAEVGDAGAVAALAARCDVAIPDFSLSRMAERFGGEPAVMSALLSRRDLPFDARYILSVERQLASSAPGESPERALREAREGAALEIAETLIPEELPRLVQHLRAASQLTPSLLLRTAICGPVALFHHAMADLGAMPLTRVVALCGERRGGGFQALCRKVGLPASLGPVLVAALDARRTLCVEGQTGRMGRLIEARRVLAHVLAHTQGQSLVTGSGSLADGALAQSLRRLDVELERQQARRTAETLLAVEGDSGAAPLLLDRTMALPPPRREEPVQGSTDFAARALVAVSDALLAGRRMAALVPQEPEISTEPGVWQEAGVPEKAEAWQDGDISHEPHVPQEAVAAAGEDPALSWDAETIRAAHSCDTADSAYAAGIPDEPIEVVIGPQASGRTALRFADLVDVARQWGVSWSQAAAASPEQSVAEATAAAVVAEDEPEYPVGWEAAPMQVEPEPASDDAPPVTTLAPGELAAPASVPAALHPSPSAIAAMLENAIAAALTSVPPPQLGRAVLEVLRPAPVIEGEWVDVAAEAEFDPSGLSKAAAA